MNPGWNFRCLNRKDLSKYLDLNEEVKASISELSPQHVADVARINLLQKYGGVWADGTCLCMVPLDDWIHEYGESGFFAFSSPGPDRLISNWFLASKKGSLLTSKLCDAVNSYCVANDFSGPDSFISHGAAKIARLFVNSNPWRSALYASPSFARLIGYTPYFWFHYAFAYTLITSRRARQIWRNTPTISSKFSTGDGPHAIQHHGMFKPISNSLADRIKAREDPLYKLNWKKSTDQEPSCSAVKFAMREVGVGYE
jgi:hypothetical protein